MRSLLQAAYAELEPRSKFAIIDDDETARYILSEKIVSWGQEPAPLGGKFSDVDELVD